MKDAKMRQAGHFNEQNNRGMGKGTDATTPKRRRRIDANSTKGGGINRRTEGVGGKGFTV